MQPQEIFDTVAKHLFTQGVQSIEEDTGRCLYRGPNGTMCAAGALISDELYVPEIEGYGVWTLCDDPLDRHTDKFDGFVIPTWMKEHAGLVSALQGVHDAESNWESTENMCRALLGIAIHYEVNAGILLGLSFKDK